MGNKNIYNVLELDCPYNRGTASHRTRPHSDSLLEPIHEPTDAEIRAQAYKLIRAQQKDARALHAFAMKTKDLDSPADSKQDAEAALETAKEIAQAAQIILDKRKKYKYFNPDAEYFSVTPPRLITYITNFNRHKKREDWQKKLRDDAIAEASWFDKLLAFSASLLFGVGILALGTIAAVLLSFALVPLSIIGIWFVVWFAPNLMPKNMIPKELKERLAGFDLEQEDINQLLADHLDKDQQRSLKLSASINGSIAFVGLTLGSPGIFFYLIVGSISAAVKFGVHACKELTARGLSDRQKIALAVCAALICAALLVFCPPAGVASSLACAGPVATALGMAHFTLAGFAAGFSSFIASMTGVVTKGLLALLKFRKQRRESKYGSCKEVLQDTVLFPPGTEQEQSIASIDSAVRSRSSTAELLKLQPAPGKKQVQADQKEQQSTAVEPQQPLPVSPSLPALESATDERSASIPDPDSGSLSSELQAAIEENESSSLLTRRPSQLQSGLFRTPSDPDVAVRARTHTAVSFTSPVGSDSSVNSEPDAWESFKNAIGWGTRLDG